MFSWEFYINKWSWIYTTEQHISCRELYQKKNMLLVHLQTSLAVFEFTSTDHTLGFICTTKYSVLLTFLRFSWWWFCKAQTKFSLLSPFCGPEWQSFLQPVYTNQLISHPTIHSDPEDRDIFLQNINHLQEYTVS